MSLHRCVPLRRQARARRRWCHRHGCRHRRAGAGRRRRGRGDGLRRGHAPRGEGHPREPGRHRLHRRRGRRVRWAGARAVLVRRRRRRHPWHREDQLPRPPPPDRPDARRGPCSPRGAAIGFISSAAGLGWEPNLEELTELLDTPDVETGVGVDRGARQGRLLPHQAGGVRLRGPPGLPAPQAGDPDQRHLPRPHRHAAGPGQQGDVARVRRRLPRGGRRRGLDPDGAGLPARVPLQRRRPRPSPASR